MRRQALRPGGVNLVNGPTTTHENNAGREQSVVLPARRPAGGKLPMYDNAHTAVRGFGCIGPSASADSAGVVRRAE
jgi:hypothetical protein